MHSRLRVVIIDPDHDRLAAMVRILDADCRFSSRAFTQIQVALDYLRASTMDIVMISSGLLHDRESRILEEMHELQAHLCFLSVWDEAQFGATPVPMKRMTEISWPFSPQEFVDALQTMMCIPPLTRNNSADFSITSSRELK